MHPTIKDVVLFVDKNEGFKTVFKNWTVPQLVYEINRGIDNRTFLWSQSKDSDTIDGIILCDPNNKTKTMYVIGVLTTRKGVFQRFLRYFLLHYKDWKLTGRRNDKMIQYNVPRLAQKLLYR